MLVAMGLAACLLLVLVLRPCACSDRCPTHVHPAGVCPVFVYGPRGNPTLYAEGRARGRAHGSRSRRRSLISTAHDREPAGDGGFFCSRDALDEGGAVFQLNAGQRQLTCQPPARAATINGRSPASGLSCVLAESYPTCHGWNAGVAHQEHHVPAGTA